MGRRKKKRVESVLDGLNHMNIEKLEKLIREQREFSDKAFGTPEQRDCMGALHHLKLEVQELIENPDDEMEWADCMLLLMDGARRKGYTLEQIFDFCQAKLEINKKRTWEKTENGVYLHKK